MKRLLVWICCVAAPVALAGTADDAGWAWSADFRARLEADWDSVDASGAQREDRNRVRARARFSLDYRQSAAWRFRLRVRSGSDLSHQSPHITLVDLDDNDAGDADFNLDRWSVEHRRDHAWAWIGRGSFPFWKQNELLWDDDVTLIGLAGGWEHALGPGRLEWIGGYFSLPVGMRQTSGTMGGLQARYAQRSERASWTAAAGLFELDANPTDPQAAILLDANGTRDYRILSVNVGVELASLGRGLAIGLDRMANLRDYSTSDPDPQTADNVDQTDGYAIGVRYGRLVRRGDWLVGYAYARIEKLAVHGSYAQDDWVRWGSVAETRSSNFEGHELRFGFLLRPKLDLLARLYLVDSITTIEDGDRLRVDFNYKF